MPSELFRSVELEDMRKQLRLIEKRISALERSLEHFRLQLALVRNAFRVKRQELVQP